MLLPRWRGSLCHSLLALVIGIVSYATFTAAKGTSDEKANYAPGQAIPVSCLNRTMRAHTNCTIASISDEFFHLLEFYVHNDAPLTCRIPTYPLLSPSGTSTIPAAGNAAAGAAAANDYIPLIFALAGTLQYSHLHINTRLNVILHTSPDLARADADILAATAYSVPSLSHTSAKIVIGDPLALRLDVRWYTSPALPPSTTTASQTSGLGGHVHFSTVVYCLLSAGVGVAASLAYFRGVELPRRIKRYGKDRVGGGGGGGGERGYAFPGSGAFGMNGYGPGKRD
ncbi:MAG: hypothetical protein Q9185_003053 [Variospora sp. 1 TL-2023]